MYQKYDAYKDSGVEWLNEIPIHWNVQKVFYHFDAQKGKKAAILTKEYCGFNEGIFPVYSGQTENEGVMGSIHSFEFDFSTDGCLFCTTVGAKAMTLRYLKNRFSLSQNCMVILARNTNIINTKFYYYAFQPIFLFYRQMIPDHMQASFRMDDLLQYKFLLPNYYEQKNIVDFLDKKTFEIDQAITIKEQQIALLNERKQIVIQQAVTKGLDPNVKMKDSGVDWIGEIPEHWQLSKLRYLGVTQNGISAGSEYFGSGYPFVSYGDVYKNRQLPLSVDGLAKSSIADQKNYSVLEGDVFFTRTSETVDEIGFASICYQTIEKATFAGFLIRFRPTNANYITKEFSKYYFNAQMMRTYFVKEMNLVIRASLSQELLKNLIVLLPSIDEQKAIASYLDRQMDAINELIELKVSAIQKLKEYKTTLINDAVTGKIKVA